MTMTQRYAGMLRRNAFELDKQEMPVQAECLRQAARHMEELQAALEKDAARLEALREALRFYAQREHFALSDANAWDTVSGEPQNYWCDDAGTATVEDGTIARAALASTEGGA